MTDDTVTPPEAANPSPSITLPPKHIYFRANTNTANTIKEQQGLKTLTNHQAFHEAVQIRKARDNHTNKWMLDLN